MGRAQGHYLQPSTILAAGASHASVTSGPGVLLIETSVPPVVCPVGIDTARVRAYRPAPTLAPALRPWPHRSLSTPAQHQQPARRSCATPSDPKPPARTPRARHAAPRHLPGSPRQRPTRPPDRRPPSPGRGSPSACAARGLRASPLVTPPPRIAVRMTAIPDSQPLHGVPLSPQAAPSPSSPSVRVPDRSPRRRRIGAAALDCCSARSTPRPEPAPAPLPSAA